MKPLNKILYVEDDEDIAEVASITLTDLGGFTIHHCLSGKEALEAFPDFQPDLVLMDVMMPQMDGLETYEKLRTMEDAKDIPIVYMTAKAQTHEQKKYQEMGAIGIIVKPFDPFTLCEQVTELWEKTDDEH